MLFLSKFALSTMALLRHHRLHFSHRKHIVNCRHMMPQSFSSEWIKNIQKLFTSCSFGAHVITAILKLFPKKYTLCRICIMLAIVLHCFVLRCTVLCLLYNPDSCCAMSRRAGIAQWLERRTRDWKVAGSNPCWNGGRIFFSRVNFLCWLLFRYPFHPRVTTVADTSQKGHRHHRKDIDITERT